MVPVRLVNRVRGWETEVNRLLRELASQDGLGGVWVVAPTSDGSLVGGGALSVPGQAPGRLLKLWLAPL